MDALDGLDEGQPDALSNEEREELTVLKIDGKTLGRNGLKCTD